MALTSEQISVANELLTAMGKTRSWVSISDLGALLTREQIEDFIGKIRSEEDEFMDPHKSSEAYPGEIEDEIIKELKRKVFVIEGSVEEGFKVSEHFARESMKQKQFIHLEDIDLGALATVIEKSMQKHLDYGTFHATRQLSATEIPEVLRKNIALAQKNKGISNDSVENIDVDALIEATRRNVENDSHNVKLSRIADNIINTMYPDLARLPYLEQIRAEYERKLLADGKNLSFFINYIEGEFSNSDFSKESNKEKFEYAMRATLTQKYFSALYPEYDGLEGVEALYAVDDKTFISSNTKRIEEVMMKTSPTSEVGKKTEQEQIRDALEFVRIEQYLDVLHPEYKEMTDEEKLMVHETNPALWNDRSILIKNIKAIDRRRKELQYKEVNDDTEDLIKKAFRDIKATVEKKSKPKTQLSKKEEVLSDMEEKRSGIEKWLDIIKRNIKKFMNPQDPGEN